jgi:hypothetical protein
MSYNFGARSYAAPFGRFMSPEGCKACRWEAPKEGCYPVSVH